MNILLTWIYCQYEYMVSLHLTLPAAVTAQVPWEEFGAALEREQGFGFRRCVKRGHMFGAQSENCLAVPLFTCLLFQGWLAGPPVSLSWRALGKISCLLISLFVEGIHLCGDFVFPPTRHCVPVLRGAVVLPQQHHHHRAVSGPLPILPPPLHSLRGTWA